jgi:hypothetical protein
MIMPEKHGIETLREIVEITLDARISTLSGKRGAGEHNGAAQIMGAVASLWVSRVRPFLPASRKALLQR